MFMFDRLMWKTQKISYDDIPIVGTQVKNQAILRVAEIHKSTPNNNVFNNNIASDSFIRLNYSTLFPMPQKNILRF